MKKLPWKAIFYIVTLVVLVFAIKYEITNNQASRDVSTSKEVKPSGTRLRCCLTFDDGPSEVTPKVLDILSNHNIKASFFLIGDEITKEREDIVKRIKDEGHLIGIHTQCHKRSDIYSSFESFTKDFVAVQQRLQEVIGDDNHIYRFPWGSMNQQLQPNYQKFSQWVQEQGYTYYDWNVSAEDSIGQASSYSIISHVQKDMKNKEDIVVLLHDSNINGRTADVLPQIIEMIEKKDYTFCKLNELEQPCQFPKEWRK